MSTTDHAAEAERILVEGEATVGKLRDAHRLGDIAAADDYGKKAMGCWAQAQVHATLALVEQQRIANDIAYVTLLERQYAEAAKNHDEFDWETRAASEERHTAVLARIREGLGL